MEKKTNNSPSQHTVCIRIKKQNKTTHHKNQAVCAWLIIQHLKNNHTVCAWIKQQNKKQHPVCVRIKGKTRKATHHSKIPFVYG